MKHYDIWNTTQLSKKPYCTISLSLGGGPGILIQRQTDWWTKGRKAGQKAKRVDWRTDGRTVEVLKKMILSRHFQISTANQIWMSNEEDKKWALPCPWYLLFRQGQILWRCVRHSLWRVIVSFLHFYELRHLAVILVGGEQWPCSDHALYRVLESFAGNEWRNEESRVTGTEFCRSDISTFRSKMISKTEMSFFKVAALHLSTPTIVHANVG